MRSLAWSTKVESLDNDALRWPADPVLPHEYAAGLQCSTVLVCYTIAHLLEPCCIPYVPTPTSTHLFSRTISLCRLTMSPLVSWLMTALLRMCLAR